MKRSPLIIAAGCALSGMALAGVPGQDPNWPCQQRLVPEETAQTYWNATLPADPDWRADPLVAKLVADVSPRDTPVEVAEAEIRRFAKSLPTGRRSATLAEAFVGIVDETNRQRTEVITRLEDLNTRQRAVADLATKAETEAAAIPADAEGDAAAKRADALQRNEFLTRSFDDTRKTIRYACEIPAQIDSRLGKFAKLMQDNI